MNINRNASIVDVRTPAEFAGQHFPGAINIPLGEVANKINEIKALQKPVVAYCRSGRRSAIATAILKQSGLTEVLNGGGLDDMLQAKIN